MNAPGIIPATEFQLPDNQPLRWAVRRLRWFKSTFEGQVRSVSSETGVTYHIDTPKMTKCFLQWLRSFEAQKPEAASEHLAYVGFAAGLMLRQLMISQPLSVEHRPQHGNEDDPAYFWPEGYVYVAYCLNVRQAIFKEDFHQKIVFPSELQDLRTWWSLKENVNEDPSIAVGFLDLFAGDEPDWAMPAIFKGRKARIIGSNFFKQTTLGQSEKSQ